MAFVGCFFSTSVRLESVKSQEVRCTCNRKTSDGHKKEGNVRRNEIGGWGQSPSRRIG